MKSYVPKRGDRVTLNSIPATVVSVDPEQQLAGVLIAGDVRVVSVAWVMLTPPVAWTLAQEVAA